jgi:hypothetical protein
MGSFSILHWIILLFFIAIPILAVILIVSLVNRSTRRAGPPGAVPPPIERGVEARLRDLDALRARGVITEAEYTERRAAILQSL